MNWANILGTAIGVAAGIIGGIFAYYIFEWGKIRRENQQQTQILKREFELNIGLLGSFLAEVENWRRAITDGTIIEYYGIFPLNRIFTIASYNLLDSGYLYQLLKLDDIIILQQMFTDYYTRSGQNGINNQIQFHKDVYSSSLDDDNLNSWKASSMMLALRDVDFWKYVFEEHKSAFEKMLQHLEKS